MAVTAALSPRIAWQRWSSIPGLPIQSWTAGATSPESVDNPPARRYPAAEALMTQVSIPNNYQVRSVVLLITNSLLASFGKTMIL